MKADLGLALARVREGAGLTQRELAARLSVHQTSLSRLEQGSRGCDPLLLRRYLRAVGTREAITLLASIEAPWRHLPVPSLLHPDIDALSGIEQGLCTLADIQQRSSASPGMMSLASLLYARLRRIGLFLVRRDHRIAFVGEAGSGKTLALCRLAGLFLHPRDQGDTRLALLEVAGGSRTICEVEVRSGRGFSIEVEPMDPEEVQRHVRDLCRVVTERNNWLASDAIAIPVGPPQEVERALLSMAGFLKDAPKDPAGKEEAIAGLARRLPGKELLADIMVRLALWRRTRRITEFDGDDCDAGRAWLQDTFAAVCSGRHPDFPLPAKIIVTVPADFSNLSYRWSFTDTPGTRGGSLEPRLLPVLSDPRTILVFCSPCRSAPDEAIALFLRSVLQTRRETNLATRAAILVTVRQGDAAGLPGPSGSGPQQVVLDLVERETSIQGALARLGIEDVSVLAFDAARGNRENLEQFFAERVTRLRKEYLDDATAVLAAVEELRCALGSPGAQARPEALLSSLQTFTGHNQVLRGGLLDVGETIVDALKGLSSQAVRAVIHGRGVSRAVDIYHHVGSSTVREIARRLPRLGVLLDGRSEARSEASTGIGPFTYTSSAVLLEVTDLEADFLAAVERYAGEAWRRHLWSDSSFWSGLEDLDLTGVPFKEQDVSRLRSWMVDHQSISDEIEAFIQRAWREVLIDRLSSPSGDERPQPRSSATAPGTEAATAYSSVASSERRWRNRREGVSKGLMLGRGRGLTDVDALPRSSVFGPRS
ncbi:helix-turn-helix domain-containing protein [Roseomonas sp. WA12]